MTFNTMMLMLIGYLCTRHYIQLNTKQHFIIAGFTAGLFIFVQVVHIPFFLAVYWSIHIFRIAYNNAIYIAIMFLRLFGYFLHASLYYVILVYVFKFNTPIEIIGILSLVQYIIDQKLNATHHLLEHFFYTNEIFLAFYAIVSIFSIAFYFIKHDVSLTVVLIYIITVFLIGLRGFLDAFHLTGYYEQLHNIGTLSSLLRNDYDFLSHEYQQTVEHLYDTLNNQNQKLLDHYLKEHNVPIYSDDQNMNFLLFYLMRHSKVQGSLINSDHLNITETLFHLVYFAGLTILDYKNDVVFDFNHSHLEEQTLILTIEDVFDHQPLIAFFSNSPLKRSDFDNGINKYALYYRFHLNSKKINKRMIIDQTLKLKYQFR